VQIIVTIWSQNSTILLRYLSYRKELKKSLQNPNFTILYISNLPGFEKNFSGEHSSLSISQFFTDFNPVMNTGIIEIDLFGR